ncbi:MAG: peptidase S41 [Phycisphaerales bacterium]|nr:MAG: peptidase S41 [Phycisphaerales bacterium]
MTRMTVFWVTLLTVAAGCGPLGTTGTISTAPTPTVAPDGEASRPRENNVDLPRYPAISPNAQWVVFTWRGDLWKVSSRGGQAVRLTTHPQDDLRSAWSWDGSRIAFESDRNGYQNIYTMRADGTDVRQVTDVDVACSLDGFGLDEEGNEVITFSSTLEGDLYRSPRPFMVPVDGGDIRRVHDAFGHDARVSHDGRYVAFTRGGVGWTRRHYRGADRFNAWLFDRQDRSFKQLTTWEGNDGRATWVGDGLIFMSDRQDGVVNLYRMGIERGDRNAARLTHFTEDGVTAFDVSGDGTTVVLTVWDTLYRLDLTQRDPQPEPLKISASEDESDNYEIKSINRSVSEAALSPDGKVMAFAAYGDVYVRNIEEKSPTVRVTRDAWRAQDIAWSPDGLKLYFVDDGDGTLSIHAATVQLTRSEIKEEFEKATRPSKEEEAGEGADEKDEKDAEAKEDEKKNGEGETGKEADAASGQESKKEDETKDEKKEEDKAKSKEEELPKELRPQRWHDAVKFNVEAVVKSEHHDRQPSPSPDGKMLAFRRGRGDLMVLDLEAGTTRALATGWDTGLNWRWSPDSRHVAYEQSNMNFNADIWIVPVDGSAPAINVTRHPDNDGNPRWSADGKILSFVSERVNEEFDVWMVYLDRDMEAMTPKELDKYYKDAEEAAKKRKPLPVKKPEKETEDAGAADGKAAKPDGAAEEKPDGDQKPAEEGKDADEEAKAEGEDEEKEDKEKEDKEPPFTMEDLQDAYLRLRRVTSWNGSEGNNEITPGGDRYIFTGSYGESGLYSIKWDGEDRKNLTGVASVQHVSLTGDKVVFVSGGRAGTVPPAGGKVEYVDLTDSIRIDLQAQSSQKFLDAARTLGEQFYHPTLKDLDWDALTRKYHALARNARRADEFNYVAAYFLGELSGSHLGIRAPDAASPNRQAMGRLGTIHHRVDGGFQVTKVIRHGPADVGSMALKPGDVVTAVNLEPFGPTDTVESRLRGRVNEETIVTIRRTLEGGEEAELNVLVTPTSFAADRQLKYEDWRLATAEKVAEWSDGRIGYIHIQGMSQPSLDVFERDLYAAASDKQGLIIDVRNNGGGWTTDRLLSSIMVQPHAYTVPRGAEHTPGFYPQDRLFIQRYALPINLLCNEKSFSNAEIISHAFKTLKRGTLVGQETHGSVISTGGTALIDGTFVRLPFRGWYLLDGTDMENHGARPHLIVDQTPEAESRDEDEQLRAAVEDLLRRL